MQDLAPLFGMNYAEFAAYVLHKKRALYDEQERLDRLIEVLDLYPEWAQHAGAELRDVLGEAD